MRADTSQTLTKEKLREQILDNYKKRSKTEFRINKVSVSKSDPVIRRVNKVLESIR